MNYKIFFFSTFIFLLSLGCTQVQNANQNDENLFQVVINSDVGQSIYYLDTDNKIKRNDFIDTAGKVTARIYNYDNNGQLQSINETSSSGRKSEFYFSYDYSRGDGQINKKTVSHTTSRGNKQKVESVFERDENNNVKKIISTDENGNRWIKKLSDISEVKNYE